MSNAHPLDRPVWSALNSGWSAYAEGDSRALRLSPAFGPFGAAHDQSPESIAALQELVPPAGELWLVEAGPVACPSGSRIVREARLTQMVADAIAPGGRAVAFEPLDDRDAPEMQALAALTRPGPFAARTHALGDFIGVRIDGKIVAMAGERMQADGFSEVSGVCTHPGHRGQGYAGALIRVVAARILERGNKPFLHSYADNEGTIALYESLGFHQRAAIGVTILTR